MDAYEIWWFKVSNKLKTKEKAKWRALGWYNHEKEGSWRKINILNNGKCSLYEYIPSIHTINCAARTPSPRQRKNNFALNYFFVPWRKACPVALALEMSLSLFCEGPRAESREAAFFWCCLYLRRSGVLPMYMANVLWRSTALLVRKPLRASSETRESKSTHAILVPRRHD